jgi:ubiquinone/menaquinone biosynthesis C-methylase UbiE
MSQRAAFLNGEGDAWFERNLATQFVAENDAVLSSIKRFGIEPEAALEIGCAGGHRISAIKSSHPDARCFGIDPSARAIQSASSAYPSVDFRVGTADRLQLPDKSIDLIIFGFCLCWTDPVHHFRIAAEADRILADDGFIVVVDFIANPAYRTDYRHASGVFTFKMNWYDMFVRHPSYSLIGREYLEHQAPHTFDHNERMTTDVIRKNARESFPLMIRVA